MSQNIEEYRFTIVLNGDGSLRTIMQHNLVGNAYTPAADIDTEALASVLPDHAALAAQIAGIEAERDAAVEARDKALADLRAEIARHKVILTREQMMAGLELAGLLDPVNGWFAGLADDEVVGQFPDGSDITGAFARQVWLRVALFSPDDALFKAAVAHFDLTDQQVADMIAAVLVPADAA